MTEVYRLTLLGSGSSGGVPRANGDWGLCDPSNPKNRRRRCAALVERAATMRDLAAGERVTTVVIDTPPDFREQMLAVEVKRLNAVLISHDHADQTHGLDDVRTFVLAQRQRMPVWMDRATERTLLKRFDYTFQTPPGSGYPPIFDKRDMPPAGSFIDIEGPGGCIRIQSFGQVHGPIRSRGFRLGNLAYSADISELPEPSAEILDGVGCWVVDALREQPHPTHFSVSDALTALDHVGAARGVLTNLHVTLDYDTLSERLPDHVVCGFGGMRIVQDKNGHIVIST